MRKENIRIAKNTIIVYVRLIITAIVGLLTSRYVLQLLGASDYGLYSVIGGVIAMFTFVSGSLQSTTVRFINYEIGKADGDLSRMFSSARQIHIMFATVIFILAELVGMLYIKYFLNMEAGKIDDAYFVFHVSVLTACLGIVNIPHQGLLIAHEKFFHVACIDILSAVSKLVMVIALFHIKGNPLRLFALGMSLLMVLSFLAYLILCWRKWPLLVKLHFSKYDGLQKEILVFNSFTLLSAASLMGRNQGGNLLINYFYGTVVNAAYAISNSVHIYVNMFAGCFDQASAPQITQSLSRGDMDRAVYLVNHTSRICILLVEIVYFTMAANLNIFLHLWLGENVPDGAATFCHLTLLLAVISATSAGLSQFIIGVGNLKPFSFTVAVLYATALLVGGVLFHLGYKPYIIILLFLFADSINRGFQLFYLRRLVKFSIRTFLREAYLRPLVVFLIGVITVLAYQSFFMSSVLFQWLGIVVVLMVMFLSVIFVGLTSSERVKIASSIIQKVRNE